MSNGIVGQDPMTNRKEEKGDLSSPPKECTERRSFGAEGEKKSPRKEEEIIPNGNKRDCWPMATRWPSAWPQWAPPTEVGPTGNFWSKGLTQNNEPKGDLSGQGEPLGAPMGLAQEPQGETGLAILPGETFMPIREKES